ncbi:unnamed protein product [Rotaria sordida]|uniref:Uncharacterized protein n=1 Tax=Rotaria sordida TaxID=392033 RepID=A0A814TXK7_9BILA|nr:unnamed protein product [Rotaria sordida]CAF1184415.1 unnamed protein product [Rotaria sordida]CAF3670162.1 unnamed protein product [Rotaria sordida]
MERSSISSLKQISDPNRTIIFDNFCLVSSKLLVCIELQEDYQLHVHGKKSDQVEDFSMNLCELLEIVLILATQTFILNSIDKTY